MSENQAASQVEAPFPLSTLRHSVAHLMASAVGELFPGVQYGFGPSIEHGSYYDFDVEEPFTNKDLRRVEKEMYRIARKSPPIERTEVTRDEARAKLEAEGQYYKVEALDLIPEGIHEGRVREHFARGYLRWISSHRQVGDGLDLVLGPRRLGEE